MLGLPAPAVLRRSDLVKRLLGAFAGLAGKEAPTRCRTSRAVWSGFRTGSWSALPAQTAAR